MEYFGKLSQPRRDLYEKVTGLQPTPAVQAHGFLTQLEQDSAMEEARRRDLIHQHVSVIAPSNRGGGKHNRGNRGGNRRGGRGQARGNLRHLSSVPTSRQQDATPAAITSAEKTASPAKPTSTSPRARAHPKVVAAAIRVAGGTKCNVECVCLLVFAKGAQLPYPSLLPTPSRWGGGFLTSRTGGSRPSTHYLGISKLSVVFPSTGREHPRTTVPSTRLWDTSHTAKRE